MGSREVVDFAVNKVTGPASKLPHGGFERPSHCAFGPDGALYVVDWGEISIAVEKGGIRMPEGSGALWRISRTDGPHGDRPPRPRVFPLYAAQLAAVTTAAVTAGAVIVRILRRKNR